MFADFAPPPTCCLDWTVLEFPANVIALLAITASTISAAIVLFRRRVHVGWIILACIVLYVALNLLVYFFGGPFQPRRNRPDPPPAPAPYQSEKEG